MGPLSVHYFIEDMVPALVFRTYGSQTVSFIRAVFLTPLIEEFQNRQALSIFHSKGTMPEEIDTEEGTTEQRGERWNVADSAFFSLLHVNNYLGDLSLNLDEDTSIFGVNSQVYCQHYFPSSLISGLDIEKVINQLICQVSNAFFLSMLGFVPIFEKHGYFAAVGAYAACNVLASISWILNSSNLLKVVLKLAKKNKAFFDHEG